MARLSEENEEVAREINHLVGVKKRKPDEPPGDLGEEIVDMIFTLCCTANSQKIDLDKCFDKIMEEKCYGRDRDRYEKK